MSHSLVLTSFDNKTKVIRLVSDSIDALAGESQQNGIKRRKVVDSLQMKLPRVIVSDNHVKKDCWGGLSAHIEGLFGAHIRYEQSSRQRIPKDEIVMLPPLLKSVPQRHQTIPFVSKHIHSQVPPLPLPPKRREDSFVTLKSEEDVVSTNIIFQQNRIKNEVHSLIQRRRAIAALNSCRTKEDKSSSSTSSHILHQISDNASSLQIPPFPISSTTGHAKNSSLNDSTSNDTTFNDKSNAKEPNFAKFRPPPLFGISSCIDGVIPPPLVPSEYIPPHPSQPLILTPRGNIVNYSPYNKNESTSPTIILTSSSMIGTVSKNVSRNIGGVHNESECGANSVDQDKKKIDEVKENSTLTSLNNLNDDLTFAIRNQSNSDEFHHNIKQCIRTSTVSTTASTVTLEIPCSSITAELEIPLGIPSITTKWAEAAAAAVEGQT